MIYTFTFYIYGIIYSGLTEIKQHENEKTKESDIKHLRGAVKKRLTGSEELVIPFVIDVTVGDHEHIIKNHRDITRQLTG